MTEVRRLLAISALLALSAVLTLSHHLWGEPGARDRDNQKFRSSGTIPASSAERGLVDDLAAAKFASAPLVTYRTQNNETLLALQVKPRLPAAAVRARDYLILV